VVALGLAEVDELEHPPTAISAITASNTYSGLQPMIQIANGANDAEAK
jgi:hypothetical protein